MNRPKREDFKSHIEYDEYGPLEFNDKSGYCVKPKTKEQWKERLMKDE